MGHRVGWHASSGLLYAEGHPNPDGLGRADDLPDVLDRLELELASADVPVPIGRRGQDAYGQRFEGFGGIRRLDSTVDLDVASAPEGIAIMAGVAAVAAGLPRMKANVWFGPGSKVQTVAMHGYAGGRMLGRFYDKGAESGTAPPGRLLRPEDQRRWAKAERRGVEELSASYVRQKFVGRFAPLWKASKGVTVGSPLVLAGQLAELQDAEELSHRQAESLAGFLLLDGAGAYRGPGRTRRRRRAELRDHGLVLADGVIQEVEVDLNGVLEAALESEAWGGQG